MEDKDLKKMIEKFFNAELSIEEERELCGYFRLHDVPEELRKDKETIIALCGEEEETALPAGADVRLETMLDSLAVDETLMVPETVEVEGDKRRVFKIPRYVWRSVAAAALLIIGFSLYEDEQPKVTNEDEPAPLIAEVKEEDTFDNPEDAMECFKGALGNMMLAVNTTHKNTRKMKNTLNKAVAPYKNMIKINIQ